jgi:septal ring-binding cell division protein DamX
LLPLPAHDIKDYVNFRLRAAGYKGPELFGPESLKLIAEASEGLTRRINIFCDKTLLAAFAAGTHTITPDLVRSAIADTQIVVQHNTTSKRAAFLAGGVALIVGLGLGFVAGRLSAGSPAAMSAAAVTAPTAAPSPAPTATTSDQGAVSTSAAAPASSAPEWLRVRADADAARIAQVPRSRYSIQLMTADEREHAAIEAYLRNVNRELNADRVMLYFSGTPENPKVSVLYGNYNDRAEASAELAGLPTRLTQFRPYARSFQAIRDDFRPKSP